MKLLDCQFTLVLQVYSRPVIFDNIRPLVFILGQYLHLAGFQHGLLEEEFAKVDGFIMKQYQTERSNIAIHMYKMNCYKKLDRKLFDIKKINKIRRRGFYSLG